MLLDYVKLVISLLKLHVWFWKVLAFSLVSMELNLTPFNVELSVSFSSKILLRVTPRIFRRNYRAFRFLSL